MLLRDKNEGTVPDLKEIYEKFKDNGLHMVSVSVDKDEQQWRKALEQENMSWSQLLVDSQNIEKVHVQFDFSSIPFVLFTDAKGDKKIKFSGYDSKNKENFISLLSKSLK